MRVADRELLALVSHLCGGAARLSQELDRDLVRRHMLAPLAYSLGYEQFQKDYIAASLLSELRQSVLDEALQTLAGLPVVLLKGISYQADLYDDPAHRPMTDIDLLVPGRAHAEALRRLEGIGYRLSGPALDRSRWHHAVQLKKRNASIDLHRSPLQPLRSRLRPGTLLERATGSRLEPVDALLVHLALMARVEFSGPLISWVDAARLRERALGMGHTTEEFTALAEGYRIRRAVTAGLELLALLRSDSLPAQGTLQRPGAAELLSLELASPRRRWLRKALLCDGPRECLGLALTALLERSDART